MLKKIHKISKIEENMKKNRFNLRNVVVIACLTVMTFVASCGKEEFTLTTTVEPVNAGSISRNPDKDKYDAGTKVTLTATVNSGYEFVDWESGGTVVFNQPQDFEVTMDANKSYTAKFIAEVGPLLYGTWTGNLNTPDEIGAGPPMTLVISPNKLRFDYDFGHFECNFNSWQTISNTFIFISEYPTGKLIDNWTEVSSESWTMPDPFRFFMNATDNQKMLWCYSNPNEPITSYVVLTKQNSSNITAKKLSSTNQDSSNNSIPSIVGGMVIHDKR